MNAIGDHLDSDERLVLDLFLAEFQPQTRQQRWLIGMLVSSIFLEPHEVRSEPKLAAYLGVSRQRVEQVRLRAMRKLRVRGAFKREDLLCAASACRDHRVSI